MKIELQQCVDLFQGLVAHYRKAGKSLYETGYYIRGRSFSRPRDGGRPGHVDVYTLDEDGTGLDTLCYNTSRRRANVLMAAHKAGTLKDIDPDIVENYANNGYNTRAGLFRSNNKLDRIRAIAKSHADYLGNESGNSTHDHNCRVFMRN